MQKLKIIIIGPERVGKSMIADYFYNPSRETPKIYRPTIGVRILEIEKTLTINGREITKQIELWDCSGSLQYEQIWVTVSHNADAVVLVYNGDNIQQVEEIEAWINNFPKKMKMSPSNCLGFVNHPSGVIKSDQTVKLSQVVFYHSCFEQRGTTIGPQFDKFLNKLFTAKMEKKEENQTLND